MSLKGAVPTIRGYVFLTTVPALFLYMNYVGPLLPTMLSFNDSGEWLGTVCKAAWWVQKATRTPKTESQSRRFQEVIILEYCLFLSNQILGEKHN